MTPAEIDQISAVRAFLTAGENLARAHYKTLDPAERERWHTYAQMGDEMKLSLEWIQNRIETRMWSVTTDGQQRQLLLSADAERSTSLEYARATIASPTNRFGRFFSEADND